MFDALLVAISALLSSALQNMMLIYTTDTVSQEEQWLHLATSLLRSCADMPWHCGELWSFDQRLMLNVSSYWLYFGKNCKLVIGLNHFVSSTICNVSWTLTLSLNKREKVHGFGTQRWSLTISASTLFPSRCGRLSDQYGEAQRSHEMKTVLWLWWEISTRAVRIYANRLMRLNANIRQTLIVLDIFPDRQDSPLKSPSLVYH